MIIKHTCWLSLGLLIFSASASTSLLAKESADIDIDQFTCSEIAEAIGIINSSYANRALSAREKLAFGAVTVGAVAASPVTILVGVLGWSRSKYTKNKVKTKEDSVDRLIALFEKKECELPAQLANSLGELHQVEIAQNEMRQTGDSLHVPPLDRLEFPDACANPVDEIRRTYEVTVDGLEPGEYLRFFTVGAKTKNQKFRADHLVYGPVQLPRMVISTRKRKKNRGLWVERVKTGERKQLNYLPANFSCNLIGTLTVDYYDLWVVVKP